MYLEGFSYCSSNVSREFVTLHICGGENQKGPSAGTSLNFQNRLFCLYLFIKVCYIKKIKEFQYNLLPCYLGLINLAQPQHFLVTKKT